MLTFLFILILFPLSFKKEPFLWLLLPFGLFLDFWNLDYIGISGLKLLFLFSVFWLIAGKKVKKSYKIKLQ